MEVVCLTFKGYAMYLLVFHLYDPTLFLKRNTCTTLVYLFFFLISVGQ